MGQLKRTHGIGSASWRAALAHLGITQVKGAKASRAEIGVHVQTMRAYIRSGRMPAFRLAGEQAIRILRSDLEKVLEPVGLDK